ncbi:IPT/TIG domain-containing protein [Actinoplanes sp. CA-252034]|uniref:IPT/TIG domain-containing protein n=1 Tax=Actinoplanes sp. CA-252034 TaxID=3239906 RepID=UPI003D98400C
MRKSKSRSKARVAAAAGLTTGAVGAALLVAPSAAFAAVTVSPPVVAVGGKVTVVDTDGVTLTTGSNASANRVFVLTAPGTTAPICSGTLPTASATVLAVTQSSVASSDTTKTVSFDSPAGATVGTNGQAKKYVACFYDDDTTARQGNQNGYTYYVGTVPALNPAVGLTGGGNTVGITTSTNVFSGVATIGGQVVTDVCPATYGAPAAGSALTVTKSGDAAASVVLPASVTSATPAPTKYNLCFYNGAASGSAFLSGSVYSASQLALSQSTGPWQGGNSINITSPNQFLAGVDDPGVLFTKDAACPTDYDDDDATNDKVVGSDYIRKLSNTRLATSVPANLYADQDAMNTAVGSGSSVMWNVCIYAGTTDSDNAASSDLVASNPYKVTTIQTVTGISPKAGPALGGSIVTVTGTAFPTEPGALTATLGGVPLTEITPLSGNAFTARTPRRAPANNVSLVVTTAGGSATLAGAYSYTSSLIATPNTAPNNRVVEIVVRGVGFESAGWSDTLTSGSHIFLVKGSYNSTDVDPGGSPARANPPVADCNKVLVLSDTEAICRLDLSTRLDAIGTALMNAVAPTAGYGFVTAAGSRLLTGDGSPAFSAADIGKSVIEPGHATIPVGTVITDVISSTKAIMSNAATGVTAAGAETVLASPITRSVTVTATSSASAALVAASGTFLSADQNKYIIGSHITTARLLSNAPTGAGANIVMGGNASGGDAATPTPAVIIGTTVPVPEGAYNLQYVSNAALNAVVNDPNYVKSQISSSSTFTVAAF